MPVNPTPAHKRKKQRQEQENRDASAPVVNKNETTSNQLVADHTAASATPGNISAADIALLIQTVRELKDQQDKNRDQQDEDRDLIAGLKRQHDKDRDSIEELKDQQDDDRDFAKLLKLQQLSDSGLVLEKIALIKKMKVRQDAHHSVISFLSKYDDYWYGRYENLQGEISYVKEDIKDLKEAVSALW